MGKPKLDSNKTMKITQLRSNGLSIPEIASLIGVPKTTVFRYARSVKIKPEFISAWEVKRGGSRRRKQAKEKIAADEGLNFIGSLTGKEKMLILASLYWAEGSKKDFGLSNSDPSLIKLFVYLLRDVLKIENDRIRPSIRVYSDLNINKSLDFWSAKIGMPKVDFLKVEVLKGKKEGRLEYGMCRIRVLKGGDFLKKIVGINKAVCSTLPL